MEMNLHLPPESSGKNESRGVTMLGEKIRRLRKSHSMTQADLAEKLGVCRQTVMKWEKGITDPDIESIRAAALLFHTSPAELLDPYSDDGGILEVLHSYTPLITDPSHRVLSGFVIDSSLRGGVPDASVEVIAPDGRCIAHMTAGENGYFIGSTGSEKQYSVRISTPDMTYEIPKIRSCPGETHLGGIDMQCIPAELPLPADGLWGDNILWKISADGVLTLSGSGPMEDRYSAPSGRQNRSPYRRLVKKVILRSGITTVGSHSFDGFIHLEEVKLGKDVQIIRGGAFMGCKKLKTVTFTAQPSAQIKEIAWNAFRGCTSLSRMPLPESVKTIGSGAFAGCVSLTSLTLPEGCEISGSAFDFCGNLKPDSVTEE